MTVPELDGWGVRYAREMITRADVIDWAAAWRAFARGDVQGRLPPRSVRQVGRDQVSGGHARVTFRLRKRPELRCPSLLRHHVKYPFGRPVESYINGEPRRDVQAVLRVLLRRKLWSFHYTRSCLVRAGKAVRLVAPGPHEGRSSWHPSRPQRRHKELRPMSSRPQTCGGRQHRPRSDRPDRWWLHGPADVPDDRIAACAAGSPWPPPSVIYAPWAGQHRRASRSDNASSRNHVSSALSPLWRARCPAT